MPALFFSSIKLTALTFPVWITVGACARSSASFFELLAYAVAAFVYWRGRRARGDHVSTESRWALAAAAVVGAVIGSRMLFWFEDPQRTLTQLTELPTSGRRTNDRRRLDRRMDRRRVAKATNRHSEPTGDLLPFQLPWAPLSGESAVSSAGFPMARMDCPRRCHGPSISATASHGTRQPCMSRPSCWRSPGG